MVSKTVTVINEQGLHMRPAAFWQRQLPHTKIVKSPCTQTARRLLQRQ